MRAARKRPTELPQTKQPLATHDTNTGLTYCARKDLLGRTKRSLHLDRIVRSQEELQLLEYINLAFTIGRAMPCGVSRCVVDGLNQAIFGVLFKLLQECAVGGSHPLMRSLKQHEIVFIACQSQREIGNLLRKQ